MPNSTRDETPRPLLLSVKTTADALGLSVWAVKKLIDADELPARRVGSRTFIPARDVYQFAHGTTPKDAA